MPLRYSPAMSYDIGLVTQVQIWSDLEGPIMKSRERNRERNLCKAAVSRFPNGFGFIIVRLQQFHLQAKMISAMDQIFSIFKAWSRCSGVDASCSCNKCVVFQNKSILPWTQPFTTLLNPQVCTWVEMKMERLGSWTLIWVCDNTVQIWNHSIKYFKT